MGSNFLCKTVLLACALSALAYGKGKLVAEHVISSSNGFYNSAPGGWAWTPDFAADDKGNLCQFFFTRGADSNVTELAYEARDKKGKIYSQGTLPEAVGASTVYIPTGVSTGNGGFSKRLLLLGYFKSMNVEYVLYKLGKNGAQKLGEKAVGTSTMFRQAFLYKGKVGIMVQDTIVAAEANGTSQTSFDITFYNKKFKESKQGGSFVADQAFMIGKGAAGLTFSPDGMQLNIKQYKP